jgi:integrase
MNIKPAKNGTYYAHLTGGQRVNLKTKSATEARSLAKAANLEQMEFAAKAQLLSVEAFQRLSTGHKTSVGKALTHWLDHLRLLRRSANTINRYEGDVRAFVAGFESKPLSVLSAKMADAYVNADVSLSTRHVRHAGLRSFFGYCAASGLCVGNPAELIEVSYDGLTQEQKIKQGSPAFSDVEIEMLLDGVTDQFWRAAIVLADSFGLRLSDIAALQWASFRGDRITVVTEKSNTTVELEVPPSVSEMLAGLPKLDPTYVFPVQAAIIQDTRKRARLSADFTRELSRVGIAGRSFHGLRRRFGQKHAALGASVDEIRRKMGHRNVETTKVYLNASNHNA